MRTLKHLAVPAAVAIGLAATLQTAAAAELEEVVVTATKRESGLQEIPMSISAISGDLLEKNGIADFTDIATSVPSVSFRSAGPGRTKLNVRGISAATGVAPTVSFYIDEMPVQTISSGSTTSFAQSIVDPKMFDLERVEVLRGPQGTLYGSSSMGGTIRLITRQPQLGEFEASAGADFSSTTGGGANYRLNGLVNVPIGESMALRVVASFTDNDGYFDRVDRATGEKFATNVNTEESTSIRAALRWEISDNSYIQPVLFYQTTEMDGKPNFDGPNNKDEQFSPYDAPEPFDDEFLMGSLTYGHDFESMSLLATYSYIDRDFTNLEDITDVGNLFAGASDPLPFLPAPAFSDEAVGLEDETIEIRLTSSSDSDLQWLVGFYRKEAVADAGYRMQMGWEPIFPGEDIGLANTQKLSDYTEDAFFGELTYNFNDNFSVTAGLRSLDYDFRSREENWGGVFTGGNRSTANVRDQVLSDSETNEKLVFTYMFGDENSVYASTSTGTRPGGINRVIPRSTDPGEPVGFACNNDLIALGVDDPGAYIGDDVTNMEFGWKLAFGDAVRLNGAFYDVEWDNIQQLVTTSSACGNNFTGNIGEASSQGLELELAAALTDNFTLNAAIGFNDAQFEETVLVPGSTADIVRKGDRLADVPKVTYNIAGDYTIPGSNGEWYVLGNLNFVDKTLELPGRLSDDISATGIDSTNVRPAYWTFDARVGFISEDGWEASFYADNLFDETALYGFNDAIAFACNSATCGPGIGTDPTVRNRPRTIGVTFQKDFE